MAKTFKEIRNSYSGTMPYKNQEKARERMKIYQQTQKYKTYDWKRRGIILHNETLIYNHYMDTEKCELCYKIMTTGNRAKDRKCLDHDHLSGYTRFICCNTCNNYLERIDNNRMKLLLDLHRFFNLNK